VAFGARARDTKTVRSRRMLRLPEMVVEALRVQEQRQAEERVNPAEVAPPKAARTMVTVPARLVRKLHGARHQAMFSPAVVGVADAGAGEACRLLRSSTLICGPAAGTG